MFQYKQTMDKILQEQIEEGMVAGASALVIHKDKEMYFNHFGYADRENKIPMKRDTIIRLFSMTKGITAVAVMILFERGQLDVKDAVSKYIPEFKNQQVWTKEGLVPVERDNTIWDLLNMTSGIPYPDESHEPGRQMGKMLRELIARREKGEKVNTYEYAKNIAKVPLCFQPGETWMYGFSADILGAVVEVVSGMRYGEFLKKELFEPLEMYDTGFFVPEEKKHRFAKAYERQGDNSVGELKRSHLGEYYNSDVEFESGGAGLVSTIDDYSHFATMLIHKGEYKGKRILGRKTVEFMTKNHLNDRQLKDYNWESLKGYGYGCLMRVLLDQDKALTNASIGEFGWDGWTSNYITMDPESETILMYYVQICEADVMPTLRKLRVATYAALPQDA